MESRRTPLPPIHHSDPIWTIEHIALVLRQETRATRTLTARPDFPPAFRLTDAANARKYWLQETVLAYLPTLCPTGPEVAALAAEAHPQPAPAQPAAGAADGSAQVVSRELDPRAAALARISAAPATSSRGAR